MKNFSPCLHQWISIRMIVFTWHPEPARRRCLPNVSSRPTQTSHGQWWSLWLCQIWGVLNWCSWSRVWKWMAHITAMFCLLNICFLPSSGFPVDTSHSSRTASPCIEHEIRLICCLERHPTSYRRSYGRPTALILIRLTTTSGAYWNSGCIASAFVTSITSWRVWLKSDRCLIRRSSTGPSSSGVHVFGHAFENKEDTLNNSCSLNLLAWLTACHCTLLETSHFECCILNVHKIGNVLYISIKITISCWFALLFICLKFQTNLTIFCCIIAISLGGPLFIGTQCSVTAV